MAVSQVLVQLESLFHRPSGEIGATLHPDFVRYFRYSIGEKTIADYTDLTRYVLRQTKWRGRILDFACGYGITSISMAALGASEVVGLDISATKVDTATKLASSVGCNSVKFIRGTSKLSFEASSFDGVLVKSAFSHIDAADPLLAEIYRVLRPGGSLLIYEDCNGFSLAAELESRRVWRDSEFGDAATLATLGLAQNFCEKRYAFLATRYPDLGDSVLRDLARRTRGYTNPQIVDYVAARECGRQEPRRFAPCVDPDTSVVQERPINPLGLRKQLQELGFSTRLLPAYNRTPLRRLIVNSLWPLSLPLTTSFCALAVKR